MNDTVTIILTVKGGKSRIVPVMKPTSELLKQYMEDSFIEEPQLTHDSKADIPGPLRYLLMNTDASRYAFKIQHNSRLASSKNQAAI